VCQLVSVLAFSFSISAFCTLVEFPLTTMFGHTAYTKSFQVNAVRPLITDNTNVFVGSYQSVTPTGVTNPIVELTPNDYLVIFPDARTPWRISVSNAPVVLNALRLTTPGTTLPTYNYTPPPVNGINGTNGAPGRDGTNAVPWATTNINNASGTNVVLTGIVNFADGTPFLGADGSIYYDESLTDGGPNVALYKAMDGSLHHYDGSVFMDSAGTIYYPNGWALANNSGVYTAGGAIIADAAGNLYGNGNNIYALNASSLTTGTVPAYSLPTITNQINSIAGIITNGGVVWFYLKTNNTPAISAPSGSFCSTTNGQFFVRSNTVWLLK
jgi:hypothetical protein